MSTPLQPRWTQDEIDDAHALPWDTFKLKHPHRTQEAYVTKRKRSEPSSVVRAYTSDKVVGDFDWRDANRVLAQMQDLKAQASFSQDEAHICIDTDEPICVVGLSDAHIGAWSADHDLFERITDEILSTPNLYVALLGDLESLNIKLRGVLEVSDNLLPPELQHRYIASWLGEVAPRILFSTWDNHAVEREEVGTGFSMYAEMMKRRVVWFNGIGHPDVKVGDQTYRFAVSHRFRGKSVVNACYGGVLYLTREGHTREIAMAGDSHLPGLYHFTHGATPKLALNAGATQLNSGFAKRYFSLTTHPIFPAVVLDPHEHRFSGLWRISDWIRGIRSAA